MNRLYLKRCLRAAVQQASLYRVLLAYPLVIILLARQMLSRLEILRAWPFFERRVHTQAYHRVGERRHSLAGKLDQFLGLEAPSRERTWRINLLVAIASSMVVTISAATALVMPQNLLLIPAWALYAIGILTYRNFRLEGV